MRTAQARAGAAARFDEGGAGDNQWERLARTIYECRREVFEAKARLGFSQLKANTSERSVRRGSRTRKSQLGKKVG
jgi:hypothetical protein